METRTITQLDTAGTIDTDDVMEIEVDGVSKKVTTQSLSDALIPIASDFTKTVKLLTNTIYGLEITNAADTEHDITIGVGYCTDSTGTYLMYLDSAITKQIDASWTAGTGNGGMFSGTVASSLCYYKHIIRKTSDGSLDAGFSTSLTAIDIPSGYSAYRCISSLWTDGSANIRNGTYTRIGNMLNFMYKDYVVDRAHAALANSSRVLLTGTVPPNCLGLFNFGIYCGDTTNYVNYGPTTDTDLTPSSNSTSKTYADSSGRWVFFNARYKVDASRQIYVRSSSGANTYVGLKTEGYEQIL